MKKKVLQLKEIKVKSFVTVLNKEEQKTAKGGYFNNPAIPVPANEIMNTIGIPYWTSEKTRATNSDNNLLISNLKRR